ncbi:hypothetical protein [uncultured Methylibium sp.]|uniref:hypothetical protein n=1 Tax=uncultured Methylibium sp. TaxID=381093 RepID=UPI002601133D|nr:hypothetical protein [uncultured Methylibium sp.]
MRTFYWVSGELTEVQRFINVPMRWCEQYPARERRELWVSTPEGQDVKIVVHSRYLPARRGHGVDALLLGDVLVGLFNRSTGAGINFVRTDPPLLWRRCDAAVVVGAPVACVASYMLSSWPWLLAGVPAALLYGATVLCARLLRRWWVRAQVDSALRRMTSAADARARLRRVK